jgi:hypothetical protein
MNHPMSRCLHGPTFLRVAVWAFVLMMVTRVSVQAYCSPEEQEEAMDQDVFYKCVRRMSDADSNGDDLMDRQELSVFIENLGWSLFVVSPFPNDTLPMEEQDALFDLLVNMTGHRIDENGAPMVDIFGSNIKDVSPSPVLLLRLCLVSHSPFLFCTGIDAHD